MPAEVDGSLGRLVGARGTVEPPVVSEQMASLPMASLVLAVLVSTKVVSEPTWPNWPPIEPATVFGHRKAPRLSLRLQRPDPPLTPALTSAGHSAPIAVSGAIP